MPYAAVRKKKPKNAAGHHLRRAGGRLSRRLPRGSDGEEGRAASRSSARSARTPCPRSSSYISGYIQGAKKANPNDQGARQLRERPDLHRPGEVQGARARPDHIRARRPSSRSPAAAVSAPCGRRRSTSVWGIGVDADQSYLGPHMLTSALEARRHGSRRPHEARRTPASSQGERDHLFNLKNGGVGLGKISPKVPKAFVAKMNAIGRRRSPRARSRSSRRSSSETRVLEGVGRGPPPVESPGHRCACATPRRPRAPRDHQAVPRRRSRTTTSTSTSAAARCMRCSARTAPGSRRS